MSVRAPANYGQVAQYVGPPGEQDVHIMPGKSRLVLRVKHILCIALVGGVAAAWYYYPSRGKGAALIAAKAAKATCQCSSVGTIAPHNDFVCTDSSKNANCGDGMVCASSSNAWNYPSDGDLSFVCQPFDCDAGLAHWQTGWAVVKIDWCCKHRHKGCGDDVDKDVSDPHHSTPTPAPYYYHGPGSTLKTYGDGLRGVKPPPGTTLGSHHKPGTTTPDGKEDDQNCRTSLDDWEHRWSKGKKAYCCETVLIGCQTMDEEYAAARDSTESASAGRRLEIPA